MTFCLETDIIIEFFRGNEKVVRRLSEMVKIGRSFSITPVTLCELCEGAQLSKNPQRELEKISTLLKSCQLLDFTIGACYTFGLISASLTREGKKLDDADLLIGCVALSHGCILVTNNVKHFERIPGLKIENWTV